MTIKIGIVYVPQRAPCSKGVACKFAAMFTVFPMSVGYEFSGGHNSKLTYQTKNYEIFLLLSCCRIEGGKNISKTKIFEILSTCTCLTLTESGSENFNQKYFFIRLKEFF